jgi:hypothetical protein
VSYYISCSLSNANIRLNALPNPLSSIRITCFAYPSRLYAITSRLTSVGPGTGTVTEREQEDEVDEHGGGEEGRDNNNNPQDPPQERVGTIAGSSRSSAGRSRSRNVSESSRRREDQERSNEDEDGGREDVTKAAKARELAQLRAQRAQRAQRQLQGESLAIVQYFTLTIGLNPLLNPSF